MIRHFNRFELKYVVSTKVRDALVERIAQHMVPDRYAGADGSYRVTSLYFDTHDLQFYNSKLDGLKYRRKLRLRVYGEVAGAREAMVEIKQRISRTVQKRRLIAPIDAAYTLCRGGDITCEDPRDATVADEVEFLVRTLVLEPKCVITYVRTAFAGGRYEPGVRLTFDEILGCGEPPADVSEMAGRHLFIPQGWAVMEVKVDQRVPMWIGQMLAEHGCELRRMSKYCSGLAHIHALRQQTQIEPGSYHG